MGTEVRMYVRIIMRCCQSMMICLALSLVLVGCSGSDVVAPTVGSIKGTVRDPAGQRALSGVQVSTVPGTSSLMTDANGAYQINEVVPGDYLVRAYYIDTSYVASGNVPVSVRAGSDTQADIMLKYGSSPMCSIKGQVVDSIGNPIAGALITTTPRTSTKLTDANGSFILHDLPPTIVTLFASRDALYGTAQIDLQQSTFERVTLTVTASDLSRGQVAGKVLTEGVPAQGAIVRIEGTSMIDTTDAYGEYIIRRVPPGSYSVRFSKQGYQSKRVTLEVASGVETRREIELRTGLDISEQNLELYLTFNNDYRDQSPAQRNIEFLGGTYETDRFGAPGGALQCYGSGGVTTSPGLELNALSMTIGAWFKIPSGNIDKMMLLGKTDLAAGEGYAFYIELNKLVIVHAIDSKINAQWKFEFSTVPRDEWFWAGYSVHSVGSGVATINGTTNVEKWFTNPFNHGILTENPFRIGIVDNTSGWQGLKGLVDHVVMYSRSMTVEELKKNMINGD